MTFIFSSSRRSTPRPAAAGLLALALLAGLGCGGDDVAPSAPDAGSLAAGAYLVDHSVSIPPAGSALLVHALPGFPSGPLDTSRALEIIGGGAVRTFGDWVFVTNSEDKTIQRYQLSPVGLVPGPKISFAERGLIYLYETVIASPTRALVVNDALYQIIEWNPTDMTITRTHDAGAARREGWGIEFRQMFYRAQDGKLFIYLTYTNNRVTTLDNFSLAVFDLASGQLTTQEDPRCGATAGFGGHFDEQGDLYLFADNFGMFTRLRNGGTKSACLLRVRRGETTIDPGYLFRFQDVLGPTRDAWGSWYAGQGVVYTSPIDLTRTAGYSDAIELILEKIHPYARVDIVNGTVADVPGMPVDGVGFEPAFLEGKLYVPRTTGKVTLRGIEQDDTRVYEIDPASNTARLSFSLPGFLGRIARLPAPTAGP